MYPEGRECWQLSNSDGENTPLADRLLFGLRCNVASYTFRPTTVLSAESLDGIYGLLYGNWRPQR
jgi:hypothetical protein